MKLAATRSKSPWFAFYTDDFNGGSKDMDLAEVGAYTRLLAYQFDFGRVPIEDRKICRIIGAFPDEWEVVKETVLSKFQLTDEGYINSRMEEERRLRNEIREKRIANGMKGGRPPAENQKVKQTETKRLSKSKAYGKASTSTSTSTSTEEVISSSLRSDSSDKSDKSSSIGDLVDAVWKASPRKSRVRSSRKQCHEAFRKVKASNRPTPASAVRAIEAWAQCSEWRKDDGAWAQGLHLWIKAERWNDLPDDDPTRTSEPSWLPNNWREIAAEKTGRSADSFNSWTDVPAGQLRMEFERACRGLEGQHE